MKHMLFFGSLRKNSSRGYNFDRFGRGTQTFVTTFTLKGYDMYSLGSYPAICPGEGSIIVELHEVEDKAAAGIERMEVGAGYTGIKILVDAIKKIEATIYTWPKERLLKGGYEKVESGDWA